MLKELYAVTQAKVDDSVFEQMDDMRLVRAFDLGVLDDEQLGRNPPGGPSSSQIVWIPAKDEMTEAGQRVLMQKVSKTQVMTLGVLEFMMIDKIEQLIIEAEEIGVDVYQVLTLVPDLAMAAQYNETPRDIATAILETDSMLSVIYRVDFSKKTLAKAYHKEELEGQDLSEWMEDLSHQVENVV